MFEISPIDDHLRTRGRLRAIGVERTPNRLIIWSLLDVPGCWLVGMTCDRIGVDLDLRERDWRSWAKTKSYSEFDVREISSDIRAIFADMGFQSLLDILRSARPKAHFYIV